MNIVIVYKVRQSNKVIKTFNDQRQAHQGTGDDKINKDANDTQKNGGTENSERQDVADTHEKQRQEAEVHLTRMLLLITTSFLVFTTPSFVR